MEFGITWNDGYVVTVLMHDDRGRYRHHPLRNFGMRQGDAKCFKLFDCPKLKDTQLHMLIKRYDPNVKYERISGNRFAIQRNE